MVCSSCGTTLLPGKHFCHQCGAPAANACTNCGSPLTSEFRFCPDCGTPVAASLSPPRFASPPPVITRFVPPIAIPSVPSVPSEPASAPAAPPLVAVEGERKLVTVMFCDIAGSTAIAERLDPEVYRELLDEYVALAFREIYRFEGVVNQLAGDGVMALFGAPIAHEDAPQRAVWAALGVIEGLQQLNQKLRRERGIELQARVGIHTGQVVVGTVGNDQKMDYTAIGDTTNLAARLESLATPGTVVVSEETYNLVRGFFEVRPLGPFDVKGKSAPIPAYQIVCGREVAHKFAIATERGLTPLVGRDQELAQIESCFERTRHGLPQVLEIVGETGSGRSRLVYEFKQRIGERAVVFETRCAALNQRAAYFPWITMLQRYFDIVPGDGAACACDKINRRLAEAGAPDERNCTYLMRLLSVGPSLPEEDLPPDDIKRATFEAIGRLFFAESRRKPVVVIIEDVHWIDDASREMLERAIGELCRTSLMFVVTHRPEFEAQWHTQAAWTRINLRPLTADTAGAIIQAVAGGDVPPELEQLILKKAEGSPFFTEEITRTLLESGWLAKENGTYVLTRSLDEVSIPGTVQEVIAARLDRLAPGEKRVLQVAAVFGRQFSREQLRELLAGEGVEVDRALDDLAVRGIIHRKNVFSNDIYRFGESLTQEVAYEGLLLRQRRQLHERVGMMLEAVPAENSAERSALLAHHFVNSENYERAADALLQAAREAEKVPSYKTAARFYRDAWDVLQRDPRGISEDLGPRVVDTAMGLARMAVFYNSSPSLETIPICETAEPIASAIGRHTDHHSLRAYRGLLLVNSGRNTFDRGLQIIEKTLTDARASGIPMPGMARGAAWAYMLDGQFDLARQTIEDALRDLEGNPRFHGSDIHLGGLFLHDRILFFSDQFEAARASALATFELAVRHSNRTVQSGSAATQALVHLHRAEYSEARRWAERGIELSKAVGNHLIRTTEAAVLVLCKIALGETKVTSKTFEEVDELVSEGDLVLTPSIIVAALVVLGDPGRALAFAQRSYERSSGRLRQALAAVALGDAHRYHDQAGAIRAVQYYQEGIELARTIGSRSSEGLAQLGIGEILAAAGDPSAESHIRAARELFDGVGILRFEERILELLGEAEGPPRAGLRSSLEHSASSVQA